MKKFWVIISVFLLLVIAGLIFYTEITLIVLIACSLIGFVLFRIAPLKKSYKARIRSLGSVPAEENDKLTA
jgi:UPF0716 family protein affecting phage T7 exclusion